MVLARFYTLCCCLSEPSIKTYRRVFTSAIGRNGVVENMLDLATCSKKLAIFIFPILFHPQTLWCMPTISVSALVGHTEDSKWVAPHPAQYPCRLPKWGQPPRHLCRQAFVNNLSRYSRGMPSNKQTSLPEPCKVSSIPVHLQTERPGSAQRRNRTSPCAYAIHARRRAAS